MVPITAIKHNNRIYTVSQDDNGNKSITQYTKPLMSFIDGDRPTKYKDYITNKPLTYYPHTNLHELKKFVSDTDDAIYSTLGMTQPLVGKHKLDFTLPKLAFMDIETLDFKEGDGKGFPNPYTVEESKLPPISAIQYGMKDSDITYVHTFGENYGYINTDKNVVYKNYSSERQLLLSYFKLLKETEPFSIFGWNTKVFDYKYIEVRSKECGVYDKYKEVTKYGMDTFFTNNKGERTTTHVPNGIEHLDYLDLYKKFTISSRESYKLGAVCDHEGVESKVDLESEGFRSIVTIQKGEYIPELDELKTNGLYEAYTNNDTKSINRISYKLFIEYAVRDITTLRALDEKLAYIEILYTIAHVMDSTAINAMGTVAVWEDKIKSTLLQHNKCIQTYNINNEHISDRLKVDGTDEQMKYAGGYTFNLKGIHEGVVTEDVLSMYPNLIINGNISPETIVNDDMIPSNIIKLIQPLRDRITLDDDCVNYYRDVMSDEDKAIIMDYARDSNYTFVPNGEFFRKDIQGIIPFIIDGFYNKRLEYKAKMKDKSLTDDERSQADRFQYVFKILMNSVYGLLGSKFGILQDFRIALSITSMGRYMIVENANDVLKVLHENGYPNSERVYSDTDSFFLKIDNDILNAIYEKNGQGTDKRLFTAKVIDKIERKYISPTIVITNTRIYNEFNQYKDVIEFSREKIINKMVVFSSKMYAIDLTDNEGKVYKDFNPYYSGISVKRSDTPKCAKYVLQELLELMLTNGNTITISRLIDTFTSDYKGFKFDIHDMAIPKGVNDIEKQYRATPIQVKSAREYNRLVDDGLFQGLEHIVSGDKIRVLYVKINKYTNKDSLAYRDKSFFKHKNSHIMKEIIDIDTMLEKTVLKKARDLLKAIGIKLQSVKEIEEDIF